MSSGSIDLQTAADQLGVHYQTAYKWVRSGQLPAELRHGRYQLDERAVDQFAERRARPRAPRPRRPRGGFRLLSERLHGYLVAGDERRARQLVRSLVDDGVPVARVAQDVFAPALARIGEDWQAGRQTISVEHRASAMVERILGEHDPRPRGRRRGRAVVAAPAGDRHSLPTAMAAAALREDNWHVDHLGADVPIDDLVSFCTSTDVDLVVLSVTAVDARTSAKQTERALTKQGLRCIVGRPGSTLEQLQSLARAP